MIIHLIILLKNSNNEIKTLTQTAGPAGATLLATAAPLICILSTNKMTNGAISNAIQQTVKVMSQPLSQNYHHYSPTNITNRSIHREYNKKKIIS